MCVDMETGLQGKAYVSRNSALLDWALLEVIAGAGLRATSREGLFVGGNLQYLLLAQNAAQPPEGGCTRSFTRAASRRIDLFPKGLRCGHPEGLPRFCSIPSGPSPKCQPAESISNRGLGVGASEINTVGTRTHTAPMQRKIYTLCLFWLYWARRLKQFMVPVSPTRDQEE